jgi:tetratricopeptide (TPR) repeat protein
MAAPQAVAAPQEMTAPQTMAPRMSAPQVMAPPAMQQAPAASMSVPANDSASLGFRKNMYEGGSGLSASPVGFRTHDESPEAAAAAAAENQRQQAAALAQQQQQQQAIAAQQQQAAPQANAGMIDAMAKVTDAEAQRDYNTAISLLRDISSNNLQNPEIHHRLAVNLLAAGQISEAISEFRIASALCPAKKIYSDDLAQALAINKRSLSDASNTLAGQTTTIGATGASK